MFEAVAFKFCPIHIKLSTSNFKLKKGLSSCDKPFFYHRLSSSLNFHVNGSDVTKLEGATKDGLYVWVPFEKVDSSNVKDYE